MRLAVGVGGFPSLSPSAPEPIHAAKVRIAAKASSHIRISHLHKGQRRDYSTNGEEKW